SGEVPADQPAAGLLQPPGDPRLVVQQVVERPYVAPGRGQIQAQGGADVARAAGDDDHVAACLSRAQGQCSERGSTMWSSSSGAGPRTPRPTRELRGGGTEVGSSVASTSCSSSTSRSSRRSL